MLIKNIKWDTDGDMEALGRIWMVPFRIRDGNRR